MTAAAILNFDKFILLMRQLHSIKNRHITIGHGENLSNGKEMRCAKMFFFHVTVASLNISLHSKQIRSINSIGRKLKEMATVYQNSR